VAIATLERSVEVPSVIGPGRYAQLWGLIDLKKFSIATTAQLFHYIDLALQNPDDPNSIQILKEFKQKKPAQCYLWNWLEKNHNPGYVEIKRRFSQEHFLSCTESYPCPGGVFVYDNLEGKPISLKELSELYLINDPHLRFVEPGFETGFIPLADYLKNPYVIAQIGGEEMLDTVERVARACNGREAYIMGPAYIANPVKARTKIRRLTALFSDVDNEKGVYLNGYYNFLSPLSYALKLPKQKAF